MIALESVTDWVSSEKSLTFATWALVIATIALVMDSWLKGREQQKRWDSEDERSREQTTQKLIAGSLSVAANHRRKAANMSVAHSINDIRTAIRELSARADLARKEGRPDDAAELERRVQGYRDELAARP